MTEQVRFSPGETILLRGILQGKVIAAQPNIIIQDKPDLLALYLPVGTLWKSPVALSGERNDANSLFKGEWTLKDAEWHTYNRVMLTIPGADYSVGVFREAANSSRWGWYINLEEPLRRTVLGFDSLDQILDIQMRWDLSEWKWKDEEDFQQATELGLIPKERAAVLRSEGEKAAVWLKSGKSPFNGWEDWRSDPSWQIPVLPEWWDIIK